MSTENLVRRAGACANEQCRHVTCWQIRTAPTRGLTPQERADIDACDEDD